ncbi:MAG TPA: amidohydrolase family protein, partial [Flavisolibacter sp.]|nr:amidohydrolase family protein [Flavisolibacter sp.]
MHYRKIAADKIYNGFQLLEQHVLIFTGDGVIEAVVPLADAGDGVEQISGILSPGFVNCHCHLELSHMKGTIAEGTGLVDFVYQVVTQRGFSEEEITAAIARAEAEMKASGIVAVGDICNNTLTLLQKMQDNLRYYNFIEASGWLPSVSEARFEKANSLLNIFEQQSRMGLTPYYKTQNCSIVPHAPYSVSEDLWRRMEPLFESKTVSIHNQETAFEDEFFQYGTGGLSRMFELMKIDNSHHKPSEKSSLQSYVDKLSGASKIILVHNTFTTQADVEYVNTAEPKTQNSVFPQTFFCLCINANQYIERALPPVDLFRSNGCSIVLGTDSLASNWSLSILDEMKTIRRHFP